MPRTPLPAPRLPSEPLLVALVCNTGTSTIARANVCCPVPFSPWRLRRLDSSVRRIEILPLLRFRRILLHQVDRLARHNGGYGVLIHQLRVSIAPQ